MNLQSIIVTNSIGCTILAVLLISSHLVRQRRQPLDRLFSLMIAMTGSACIVETITFILDGAVFPYAKAVDIFLNSWLYAANVLVSFIWWVYVDYRFFQSEKRLKSIYTRLAIPSAVAILLLFVNPWTEWFFRIDENMRYCRCPAGYLYFAVSLYHLFGSLVTQKMYYKRYGKTKFFPILMFLVPIFAGMIVQMFVYGVSLAWCAVCVGLVGIYMSLQNELSFIDPLTKLYNRNYLAHVLRYISSGNKMAAGIMIDLDFFKSINDTFGHSVGDEALVDAARIIRKSVPEDAVTVRYAGDEFIVIIRTGGEKEIDDMIGMIRNNLMHFNESHEREYTLSFSIGYSIYDPDMGDADSFMHQMDENMYQEKRTKHTRSTSPTFVTDM